MPDVSGEVSSSSTNEIGLEKRRLGAFTNIGEEINPSENFKTEFDPLPLFTLEVTFKEFTTIRFVFPIPFDLFELENGL